MEQKNNKQTIAINNIELILDKMSSQIAFLIRNKESLNQLDIDSLMRHTRRLYDILCSIKCEINVDSIPMEIYYNKNVDILNLNEENEKNKIKKEEKVDINDIETSNESVEQQKPEEKTEKLHQEEQEKEVTIDFDNYYKNHIIEHHQTLGEKLERQEDNSLAAHLKNNPLKDLTNAIGINDKFLLLNELFKGSMEKYNKSIKTLNEFSTLTGAKTYMSELEIEFQWNCDSKAYNKLLDLIERRFIQ